MKNTVTEEKKRQIVNEYLTTPHTLRSLEKKHGYDFRIIGTWVKKYEEKAEKVLEEISPVKRKSSDSEFIASIVSVCQKYGMNADITIRGEKVEAKITG
jgi:transposase-like protein